jgi:hypothetical protein
METILGIAVGIGLSAACGFLFFVPLLIMNIAAISGQIKLLAGFAWMDGRASFSKQKFHKKGYAPIMYSKHIL